MTEKTTQETITAKELANRAGVTPTRLRRVIRDRFPRDDKGKAYEWAPDDPQIELILKAIKNNGKIAEKAKPEKATKKEKSQGEKTAAKLTRKAPKKTQKTTTPTPAKPYAVYDEITGEVEVIKRQEPTEQALAAIEAES